MKKTTAQLKKEFDRVFSIYIRTKFSKNGLCWCYTCGKQLEIKQSQCGHFVPRQFLSTRWEEDNCRPQCVGCNIWGKGQILTFEERLKKELGSKRVEELKKSRHKIIKIETGWYEEMIDHYKKLLNPQQI